MGTNQTGVHLWPFGRETFPKQNKNTRRERFPPDGNHRWDSFSHSWNAVGRVCTIFFILWLLLLLLWPSSRRPPYSNTITRGFVLQVNNNRYAQLGDSLTFVRWPAMSVCISLPVLCFHCWFFLFRGPFMPSASHSTEFTTEEQTTQKRRRWKSIPRHN